MTPTFNVSYCTKLPTTGDCPRVTITDGQGMYFVNFFDNKTNELIHHAQIDSDGSVSAEIQYFVQWKIVVMNEKNQIVFFDLFDPKGKNVFIKIDAYALGDNLAWFPFIEEFRKTHSCNVICSTFFNELFCEQYKDILFVKPNTEIKNIYAQYYIGANEEENKKYSTTSSRTIPLQQVSSNILGLPFKEIRPRLNIIPNKLYKKPSERKYVCISERASHSKKEWKNLIGWQKIVDWLSIRGFDVVVISKESTELTGIVDKTGNIHLQNRMKDLLNCEFFIGVSSGLSWLAWSLGTKTVIISDVTPSFHEPSDVVRINASNKLVVDYELSNTSSFDDVISKIEELI